MQLEHVPRTLLLLPLLLSGAAVAHGQAANAPKAVEATFETGYARAKELAREGRWKPAWNAWLDLLRDHAGADYVRPRLPDVRESLKSASFWMGRRRPEPAELVSGRLDSYWRRKGRLRITYTPFTLGDFERQGELFVHPVRFRGPYTLTVRSDDVGLALRSFAVAMDGDDLWEVSIGDHVEGDRYYTPHRLVRVADGKPLIADLEQPRTRGLGGRRKAALEIRVTKTDIRVVYDGRPILSGRKVNDAFGGFGFGTAPGFDELSVDGIVEPAWLEGLADEALQDQRRTFEASWKEPDELSPWSDGPAPAGSWRGFGEAAGRILSGLPTRVEIPPRIVEVLEEVSELTPARAENELRALSTDELTPTEREYAVGLVWAAAGRMTTALRHLDRAAQMGDPPLELEVTRARLRWKIEDHERAVTDLGRLCDQNPEDLALLVELGDLLLARGRWTEARARIEAGLEKSPTNGTLRELRDQVVKAEQGPAWQRPWIVERPRFTVVSDLNSNVCKAAAREVGRTLRFCEELFGPLPDAKPGSHGETGAPRTDELGPADGSGGLPVYLFSGEAGYAGYVEGVEAQSPEHSYGMYSRRLQQILVWNVPSRAMLESVLRHECVHHYIEMSLGEAPPWLHEGLAEYVAAAGAGEAWEPGAANEERLVALRANGWDTVPLEDFLFMSHGAFLENAELHYSMAWAFVDFLLGPRRTHRDFFDRLWTELSGPIDAGTAVERALGDLPIEDLEKDFREHLSRFRRR